MKTLTQTSLLGEDLEIHVYSKCELEQATTAELVQILLQDNRGKELEEFMSESRLRKFLIDKLSKEPETQQSLF